MRERKTSTNSPRIPAHSDLTVCFDLSWITPYLISQVMAALNIKDLLLAPQLDRQTVIALLQKQGYTVKRAGG